MVSNAGFKIRCKSKFILDKKKCNTWLNRCDVSNYSIVWIIRHNFICSFSFNIVFKTEVRPTSKCEDFKHPKQNIASKPVCDWLKTLKRSINKKEINLYFWCNITGYRSAKWNTMNSYFSSYERAFNVFCYVYTVYL